MGYQQPFLSVVQAANIAYEIAARMTQSQPGVEIKRRNDLGTMLMTDLTVKVDRGSSAEAELMIRVITDDEDFHKRMLRKGKQSKYEYKFAVLDMQIVCSSTHRTPFQAQVLGEVLLLLAQIARVVEAAIGPSRILLKAPEGNNYAATNLPILEGETGSNL